MLKGRYSIAFIGFPKAGVVCMLAGVGIKCLCKRVRL